jgi:hypothetical protein
MKSSLFIITLLVVLFSSCSKEPKNIKTIKTNAAADKNDLFRGITTDGFKDVAWRKHENENKTGIFNMKEISTFPIEEQILADAYQKNEDVLIVTEDIKGDIKYYEVSGESFFLAEVYENIAVDKDVISTLKSGETFWGYQRIDDYLSIIKDNGTAIYKGSNMIYNLDGVAKIQDLDGNDTLEVVQRSESGKKLCVYEIKDMKFIKLWELEMQSESFDGDIQIGDLNNDGVKEFYVGNTLGNMIKFTLTEDGFVMDERLPVLANGIYYLVDYDKNNKMDIIIQKEKKKPVLYLQK